MMLNKKKLRALRHRYLEKIKIPEFQEGTNLFTFTGLKVATGYIRIVVGGRGPYMEFDKFQMVSATLKIPQDQEWRKCHGAAYYVEYRTTDSAFVKVYFQKRKVDYADYRIGYLYIDPMELTLEDGTPVMDARPSERRQMGLFCDEPGEKRGR